MTKNELRNKAYSIASGAFLCEVIDFDMYDKMSDDQLTELATESTENYDADYLRDVIENLAGFTVKTFEDLVK